MAKLTYQRHSMAGDDYWHSILISLLRGFAAIQVAAAHLRSEVFPGLSTMAQPPVWYQGLAFATGFAHHAVLVFFVISGWLVGGSLLDKFRQPDALANYAIDRATRLWTVLVPTFVLTLLFAWSTGVVGGHGIDFAVANDHSATAFAGNLVGLQPALVPYFGDNFALWSLANETWYYVLFPLLVALLTARRRTARIFCAAALLVLALWLPAALLGYFATWLLGVAFSRIRIEFSAAMRIFWLVLLAAVSVYYRLAGDLDNYDLTTLGQDLVCSLVFLVLLASMQIKVAAASKLAAPLARLGRAVSNFSFSLYVMHLPLLGLMLHWGRSAFGLHQLSPTEPLHYAAYFAMLAMLLAGSWLTWLLFESQTYRLRRLAKRLLLQHRAPRAAVAVLRAD